jgi:hypothetical protein
MSPSPIEKAPKVSYQQCGFAITAEHKVNRFGSRYVYYHCTRKRRDYRCRQPVVPLPDLERQLGAFLNEVSLLEPPLSRCPPAR